MPYDAWADGERSNARKAEREARRRAWLPADWAGGGGGGGGARQGQARAAAQEDARGRKYHAQHHTSCAWPTCARFGGFARFGCSRHCGERLRRARRLRRQCASEAVITALNGQLQRWFRRPVSLHDAEQLALAEDGVAFAAAGVSNVFKATDAQRVRTGIENLHALRKLFRSSVEEIENLIRHEEAKQIPKHEVDPPTASSTAGARVVVKQEHASAKALLSSSLMATKGDYAPDRSPSAISPAGYRMMKRSLDSALGVTGRYSKSLREDLLSFQEQSNSTDNGDTGPVRAASTKSSRSNEAQEQEKVENVAVTLKEEPGLDLNIRKPLSKQMSLSKATIKLPTHLASGEKERFRPSEQTPPPGSRDPSPHPQTPAPTTSSDDAIAPLTMENELIEAFDMELDDNADSAETYPTISFQDQEESDHPMTHVKEENSSNWILDDDYIEIDDVPTQRGIDRNFLDKVFKRASDAFQQGLWREAERNFRVILRHVPTPSNYNNVALSVIQSGDVGRGFKVYEDAVARFPDDGDIHVKYCLAVAKVLNNPNDHPKSSIPTASRTTSVCAKSVDLSPKDSTALHTYANVLVLLKEYELSIGHFQNWIHKFSSFTDKALLSSVKSNLAVALVSSGRREEAYQVISECMESENRSSKILRTAAHIRQIGWPMDSLAWELSLEATKNLISEFSLQQQQGTLCEDSSRWRLALNFTEEAQTNPNRLSVTYLNPETMYQTYGRENDPLFIFPNAYVSGHGGFIHHHCVLYAGSHHSNIDLQGFPAHNSHLTKNIQINEPVVSVIQHQSHNYYHFLLETLPKLLLLNQHILSNPEFKNVRVLVPEHFATTSFVKEILSTDELAVLKSRFIFYKNPSTTRYHFTNGLTVISWLHPSNDTHQTLVNNVWSVFWPPKQIHLLIRGFFQTALKTKTAAAAFKNSNHQHQHNEKTIIYISRPPSSPRSFPNDAAIQKYLQSRFGTTRLRIHTGAEPFWEQVALFSTARVVVGAHGAGLTNYLFTKAMEVGGTLAPAVLVVVPLDPHVEFCFSQMVAAVAGRHYMVSGLKGVEGAGYYGGYGELGEEDLEVLGDAVEMAWVEAVGGGGKEIHDEL
ncbi:hypothetical protein BDR26DRAFT_931789 [Obelidium mucronatum]|nr:hypothetical protein BDR26DRAFT_931789 [Obelidium mucronatum]